MPQAVPAAARSTRVRSAAEYRSQYETLRRQALEPSGLSGRNGVGLAFIERVGVAAWMEHAWDGPADGPVSAAPPGWEPGAAEPLPRDWMLVLVNLVMGDRQEVLDGGAG